LKEITEDQLLDIVYNILQLNCAMLKNGSLEHEDHDAYFRQHLAILKKLIGRDKMVEPGGIAQSPDGKLWRVVEVDDEKIALRRLDDNKVILSLLRGGQRIEISWKEWATGWELKFP